MIRLDDGFGMYIYVQVESNFILTSALDVGDVV